VEVGYIDDFMYSNSNLTSEKHIHGTINEEISGEGTSSKSNPNLKLNPNVLSWGQVGLDFGDKFKYLEMSNKLAGDELTATPGTRPQVESSPRLT